MTQSLVVVAPTSGQAASDAAREVDLWRARRRVASLPCGQVAYVDEGAGAAALFIHGFPLSGFQWRYAIERLADVRRCLAPDLLGLGDTDVAPGQSVAPTDQAQMLVALLD